MVEIGTKNIFGARLCSSTEKTNLDKQIKDSSITSDIGQKWSHSNPRKDNRSRQRSPRQSTLSNPSSSKINPHEKNDTEFSSRQRMHGNKNNIIPYAENVLPHQGMENNRDGFKDMCIMQAENKRKEKSYNSSNTRFDAFQKSFISEKMFLGFILRHSRTFPHIRQW